MGLTASDMRHRDQILAAAVQEGKLVYGSKAWLSYRDLFHDDPSLAERGIAALAANPLVARAQAGYPAGADFLPPNDDSYDPAWLSAPERNRIARAHQGYEPVSHTFE